MSERPPSVDSLARVVTAGSSLPHALAVRCARLAIAGGGDFERVAMNLARGLELSLVQPVINATGVLLHTNLGRAPLDSSFFGFDRTARPTSLEFDLNTGNRGSRLTAVATLLAELTGAEDALVVNNNAAAVLLVVGALAAGRDVAVSRGESVEIGGGFRIPEVLEQSGARLVVVGTTNKTRASDYERAIAKRGNDIALIMRVHPSNFHIEGFTQQPSLGELSALGVPVVSDIGSGLLDARCPWVEGPPPAWLHGEPAARQTLADGAALVTFSGDKLMGGPQCGIIAGRADLVAACRAHPLMRALRPGGQTLIALQQVLLAFAAKRACTEVPFWAMATTTVESVRNRAEAIVDAIGAARANALGARVETSDAVPGAGSTPGATIPSAAVVVDGDRCAQLRACQVPVIARREGDRTVLDLRSVALTDDAVVVESLASLTAS
ncbi:MAG: L-seryl-tRNA(Sec) selenium transferase [Actinomycetota bacterium]